MTLRSSPCPLRAPLSHRDPGPLASPHEILLGVSSPHGELSGGGNSETDNLVTGSSSSGLIDAGASDVASSVPSVVYHAVPILVLLVAGFLVVRQARERSDTASAAAAGATVAAGYLVLAVVGAFLFENSDALGDTAPELITSVLLAGLAFPLVLGAIGGAISNEV